MSSINKRYQEGLCLVIVTKSKEGMSLTGIAEWLNKQGMKTVTGLPLSGDNLSNIWSHHKPKGAILGNGSVDDGSLYNLNKLMGVV